MVWKENPMTKLPPQSISPLIRFARWSALLLGITYGSMRLAYLTRKEKPIQEEMNKLKAAKKIRLAKEWQMFEEEQMADIRRQVAES